jgi:isoquinoline 1-oxidoreductase beta subunit
VRKVVKLPDWTAPCGLQAARRRRVVADHTWAALQGRKALVVEWEDGPNASYDSTAYRQSLPRRR